MGRKLYVGNLPYSTSETELEELFGRAGAVEIGERDARHGHGARPRVRVRRDGH